MLDPLGQSSWSTPAIVDGFASSAPNDTGSAIHVASTSFMFEAGFRFTGA